MNCQNIKVEKPSLAPLDIASNLPKMDLITKAPPAILPITENDAANSLTDVSNALQNKLTEAIPVETVKKQPRNWWWLALISGVLFYSVNYTEKEPVKAQL